MHAAVSTPSLLSTLITNSSTTYPIRLACTDIQILQRLFCHSKKGNPLYTLNAKDDTKLKIRVLFSTQEILNNKSLNHSIM